MGAAPVDAEQAAEPLLLDLRLVPDPRLQSGLAGDGRSLAGEGRGSERAAGLVGQVAGHAHPRGDGGAPGQGVLGRGRCASHHVDPGQLGSAVAAAGAVGGRLVDGVAVAAQDHALGERLTGGVVVQVGIGGKPHRCPCVTRARASQRRAGSPDGGRGDFGSRADADQPGEAAAGRLQMDLLRLAPEPGGVQDRRVETVYASFDILGGDKRNTGGGRLGHGANCMDCDRHPVRLMGCPTSPMLGRGGPARR